MGPVSPYRRIETPLPSRGVRVWHFILIPPISMAILLGVFRVFDRLVLPHLQSPAGVDVYRTVRTILIGLAMASVIAVLAVRYRTGYEREIQARNDALEATRDFLTRIIEGTADAVVVREAEGRITGWRPDAGASSGRTAAERMGQTAQRLGAPSAEPAPSVARIDAALREGRTLRNLETGGARKDGTPITVSLTVAPIYDAADRFAGTSGIVRDVTAIKQLQLQLLQRERLAAVGELAAMVAHEVRNPLAGIRGGCEILLEGYPEGDSRHEIGVEIIRQVDRLSRTVHDLLLFARPKAMDLVPTDLHGLIERIVHVLGDDPRNAAVEIVRDFGAGSPIVRADGRQMEQVFMNLILNAIQALNHGGRVTIATRSHGRQVAVEVSDTGPGVPQDKLERIFEPFFTTRSQGTG